MQEKIYVKDLLIYLLKQWKKFLVATIFFGILFGGYQLVSEINKVKNPPVESEDAKLEREENKLNYERISSRVKRLESSIEILENIMNNSLLNKWDADTIITTELVYYFKLVNETFGDKLITDPIDTVIAMYDKIIMNELLSTFSDKYNLNISEMELQQILNVSSDNDGNMLIISFVADSDELTDALTKEIEEYVSSIHDMVVSYVGYDFEVDQYSKNSFISTNNDILDYQITFDKDLKEQYRLLSAEKADLDNLNYTEQDPAELNKVLTINKISIVKYGIAGGLFAIFLIGTIMIIFYLLDNKIRNIKQLKDIYDLQILGNISEDIFLENKGPINKFINKLEYGNPQDYNKEENIKVFFENLKIKCSIDDLRMDDCLLYGGSNREKLENIRTEYINIKSEDHVFEICDNNDSELVLLRMLQHVEQVVLVVEKDLTQKIDIMKKLELLNKSNKKVMGALLI